MSRSKFDRFLFDYSKFLLDCIENENSSLIQELYFTELLEEIEYYKNRKSDNEEYCKKELCVYKNMNSSWKIAMDIALDKLQQNIQ